MKTHRMNILCMKRGIWVETQRRYWHSQERILFQSSRKNNEAKCPLCTLLAGYLWGFVTNGAWNVTTFVFLQWFLWAKVGPARDSLDCSVLAAWMAELTCSSCEWFFWDVNSHYCCNSGQSSECSLSVIISSWEDVNTKGNLCHVRGWEVPTLNGCLDWCKVNTVKNGLAKGCRTLLHCVLRLCRSDYIMFCWGTTNCKICQSLNYGFVAKITKFDACQFFPTLCHMHWNSV